MIVIKLGGSLYGSPQLQQWLDQIVASDQPIIIVPGGGPFADQVRDAQQQHPLPDPDAHHMALLAMAQFGLLLCGLQPSLAPYYIASGRLDKVENKAIWIPSKHLLHSPDIPHNWTVTSDSLALWLAQQLGADKLLIVKSASLADTALTIEQASSADLLDSAFPHYYQQNPIPTTLFHAQHSDQLHSCLSEAKHSGLTLL